MKKFWIRMINVCVIVAALIGYSKVTLAHEQTDAAAKAEADRKNAEIAAEAGGDRWFLYRRNLSGYGHRFGGDITVEVTLQMAGSPLWISCLQKKKTVPI